MSTLENKQPWPIKDTTANSKYEKCLNITEEIYKRINITFEIKKLESGSISDISNNSDQIDSNDLSNETDLFAYEKSTSISSSVSDITQHTCEKFINLNNNEEGKMKKVVPYVTTPRPKKRFRKRVKKRQLKNKRNDSDCSSDEGLPLSRIVDGNMVKVENEDLKIELKEVNSKVLVSTVHKTETEVLNLKEPGLQDEILDLAVRKKTDLQEKTANLALEPKFYIENVLQEDHRVIEGGCNICPVCNAYFKGVRGLKRHMTMSHMQPEEIPKTISPTKVNKDVFAQYTNY